jgi:hypothetical protein
MTILLAPAETKQSGGINAPLDIRRLHDFQKEVLEAYEEQIKNSTIEELSDWFGLKNLKEVEKFKRSILDLPTLKAIQRYTGVAFDAIDYNNLDAKSKQYIDNNTYIFSNFFGMVRANFPIPEYKFKQGKVLKKFDNIKLFKKHLKSILDNVLGDEILDLSASHYNKFYKPSANVITFKFLKDGKVVSHWAKHYRGAVLKEIALNNISNFKQLLNHNFDGLELKEIQEKKNIKTVIVNITKEGK